MTTLDMQKENAVPSPELDIILRHSQKRHTVYEKTDKAGQETKSQKPAESHVEQLEWEVCLRKYFDYVETQTRRSDHGQRRRSEPILSQSTSLVRYPNSVEYDNVQDWSRSSRRYSTSSGRKLLTYGTSMEGQSYNEIYTRPRRNSTASRASSVDTRSRNNSISSVQSVRTVVTSSAHTSQAMSSTQREYSANPSKRSPSPPVRAPYAEQTISRAWKDIVNATQTMPILEARAYIEGRLAGLDSATIGEIRKAMSGLGMSSPNFATNISQNSTTSLPSPISPPEPAPTQVPVPRASRSRFVGPVPVLTQTQSMPIIKTTPPSGPLARETSEPVRSKAVKKPSLHRPTSQNRLSGSRNDHARQLSTIAERPSTSRSRGGESIKSRKSIFSMRKEKPPPLPEKPELPAMDRKPSAGSNFSSDGSTLRGTTPEEKRIVELEEVPEEPGPLPTIKSNKRGASNPLTSKPLPMTPADLQPDAAATPTTSVKSRISRLFRPISKRRIASLPSAMSTPTLSIAHAGMKSRETLSHMSNASLECLRKGGMNGSRSTLLVAYQEGPDQPFQVWLNALPYIEGRAGAKV
jgi:hypothetical protein